VTIGDITPCRITGVTLHSHVRYGDRLARAAGLRSPSAIWDQVRAAVALQRRGAVRGDK